MHWAAIADFSKYVNENTFEKITNNYCILHLYSSNYLNSSIAQYSNKLFELIFLFKTATIQIVYLNGLSVC